MSNLLMGAAFLLWAGFLLFVSVRRGEQELWLTALGVAFYALIGLLSLSTGLRAWEWGRPFPRLRQAVAVLLWGLGIGLAIWGARLMSSADLRPREFDVSWGDTLIVVGGLGVILAAFLLLLFMVPVGIRSILAERRLHEQLSHLGLSTSLSDHGLTGEVLRLCLNDPSCRRLTRIMLSTTRRIVVSYAALGALTILLALWVFLILGYILTHPNPSAPEDPPLVKFFSPLMLIALIAIFSYLFVGSLRQMLLSWGIARFLKRFPESVPYAYRLDKTDVSNWGEIVPPFEDKEGNLLWSIGRRLPRWGYV